MPNPIPTLGYPTRTEAVLALHNQGTPIKDIASKIGISEERALRILWEASPDRRTNLSIERSVLIQMTPDADRRGMSSRMLAAHIVRTVVSDGLIDAVLDDRPTSVEVRANV